MEQKKRNLFFFITAILSIVLTVYVLYLTVFDQILSRNQGYFYAGFFGFILLLVFLLCNLVTKLIAISTSKQDTIAWKVVGIVVLVLICIIFVATRLSLSSNLSASDSSVYKGAITIMNGNYYQNDDLVRAALNNPAQYLYSLILSVVFKVFGEDSKTFIITNSIFYALCIVLIFNITLKLTDRMCGIFAALLSIFVPAQTFAAYCYDTNPIVSLLSLLCLNLYISLLVSINGYNSQNEFAEGIDKSNPVEIDEEISRTKSIIYTVLCAIFTGFLIFIEPVMLVVVLLMVLTGFMLKKKYVINLLIAVGLSIIVFSLLTFVKSSHMQEDFGKVFTEEFGTFNFFHNNNDDSDLDLSTVYDQFSTCLSTQNENITDNYYFLYKSNGEVAYTELSSTWVVLENQIFFMFLLIMLLSCNFIAIKENMVNFTFINIMFIGTVLLMLFQQNRDTNKNIFMSVLIITCAISIHYLYLDHHPEQRIVLNTIEILEKSDSSNDISGRTRAVEEIPQMSEIDFERRARALVFIGNDDSLYNQIKLEEHRLAMRQGRLRKNDALDDMDEEDFFDKEDDEVVPAYKSKPVETIGDDNMYFDEEEAEAEQAEYNSKEKMNTEIVFNDSPVDDMPKVEKITRNTTEIPVRKTQNQLLAEKEQEMQLKSKEKEDKKTKKIKQKESKKNTGAYSDNKLSSTLISNNAVRKIKKVGGQAEDAAINQYLAERNLAKKQEEERFIPNPLPVPEKKEHKAIDYDVKVEPSGWDYDYDVDDDDDWDV